MTPRCAVTGTATARTRSGSGGRVGLPGATATRPGRLRGVSLRQPQRAARRRQLERRPSTPSGSTRAPSTTRNSNLRPAAAGGALRGGVGPRGRRRLDRIRAGLGRASSAAGTFFLTNELEPRVRDRTFRFGDEVTGRCRRLGRQRHPHRRGHSWLLIVQALGWAGRRRGAARRPAERCSKIPAGHCVRRPSGIRPVHRARLGPRPWPGPVGAYGYATTGWPYQQIVSHYYGGTTLSTQPDSAITVNLLTQDGRTSSSHPGRTSSSAGSR